MNGAFFRYFLLLSLLVMICFGSLGFMMMNGRKSVDEARGWVQHSQTVISQLQKLNLLLERVLADQRGYMLWGKDRYKKEYQADKVAVTVLIQEMDDLTADNTVQKERLKDLRAGFADFTRLLDARLQQYRLSPRDTKLVDSSAIDRHRDNLAKLTRDVIDGEYGLLNIRVQKMQAQRNRSFYGLLTGGCISAILLLLFNGFIFVAQSGRMRAEKKLDEAQEIFRLALEGAQDGIYDWNLKTGEAFYTRPFWDMLGYGEKEFPATMESFQTLLHPEDRARVEEFREKYLGGVVPEYSLIFRMKHKNGRWIWINARGKAIYGPDKKPVRMVGAHSDISHIKAYEEKLEKSRDRAEKASRAKTDFLAHMSHEIRTPLTAITGIAEIFGRNQKNLDDKQKLLVKTLHSSSSLLAELVNDILDFSRIEGGELKLEDRLFGLPDLFEQVINVTAVAAKEKNIEFKFDYNDVRNIKISGDKVRLRQILINLVGNAIKFTQKGSVRIRAYKLTEGATEKLRVDVIDTGIGIEQKNFELVFEQFKQADSSVSRKYGGSGLGLAISLRLAQLMGGTILLESAIGKGSVFSLIIPLKTGESSSEEVSDEKRNLALTESIRAMALEGKRILMAEDYEGNIVMLGYILDSLDCVYDVARTGREALTLWEKNRYDLILMDIQMPEMDGLTATAQIRQREKEKKMDRVPIIGMTAHALIGDAEKCIEAGLDVYLPKPVAEIDLKARIAECLTQARRAA